MNGHSISNLFSQTVAKHENNLALIVHKENSYKTFTYCEIVSASNEIVQQISCYIEENSTIGVLIGIHPIVIPIVNAIHSLNCNFIFLNPNDDAESNEQILKNLNIKLIFSLENRGVFNEFQCTELPISNVILCEKLYLWRKEAALDQIIRYDDIAYIVRTSGSTGAPKCVAVTHDSIFCNVCDFERIFSMLSSDIIYFSTPLTFDPSMIEIYLAIKCGAALLIAEPDLKTLFEEPFAITVWQTTPSKLLLYGKENIQTKILSAESKLKILGLGGEPITCDINQIKHCDNRTFIFNLYGITEVSCWASINRIDDKNAEEHSQLGEILSETLLGVFQNDVRVVDELGCIFIGSHKRKCYIDDEIIKTNDNKESLIWRNTGDVGIEINDVIYFKGRCDRIIKRFGHKIDLLSVEIAASRFDLIEKCMCFWDHERSLLILFYTSESSADGDLKVFLKENLNVDQQPDYVIRVPDFPLNEHGKVSQREIKKMYSNFIGEYLMNGLLGDLFFNLFKELFPTMGVTDVELKKRSFASFGGTSFLAVQLINNLEKISNLSFYNIYTTLLDSKVPLVEIIELLNENVNKPSDTKENNILTNKRLIEIDKVKLKRIKSGLKYDVKEVWHYNMKKCIDGSPVLFSKSSNESHVIVGSHSGEVAVLNSRSGSLVYSISVDSRVEASAFCYETDDLSSLAVIGTYDGTLWCFSIFDSEVVWKANLGAMIKSSACKINKNVYAANYDGVLFEVNAMTGEILSSIDIKSKGITADLITSMDCVFLGSLNGTCAKVCFKERGGKIMWRQKLESPIFARPSFLKNESQIMFNEVKGKIHCFDACTGNKLWTYIDVSGLLFSACRVQTAHDKSIDILFGCHDQHVYKLNLKVDNDTEPILQWRTEYPTEVYSTPCPVESTCVLAISTDGHLKVIDLIDGETVAKFEFPGKVFSSPKFEDGHVFVGCRDDNLYCLSLSRRK